MCVQTTVSLGVSLAEVELSDFGDIEMQLLVGEIGGSARVIVDGNGLVVRVEQWACLVLMTIRRVLVRDEPMPYLAKHAAMALGEDITNHGQHRRLASSSSPLSPTHCKRSQAPHYHAWSTVPMSARCAQ